MLKAKKITGIALVIVMIAAMLSLTTMNVSATANADVTLGTQSAAATAGGTADATATFTVTLAGANDYYTNETFTVTMDGNPTGISAAKTTDFTKSTTPGLITITATKDVAMAGKYPFTVTTSGATCGVKTLKGTFVLDCPTIGITSAAVNTVTPLTNELSATLMGGFVGDDFKAVISIVFDKNAELSTNPLKKGDVVTNAFLGLPTGLKAVIDDVTTASSVTTVKVEISGKPTSPTAAAGIDLQVLIPKARVGSKDDVNGKLGTCKIQIMPVTKVEITANSGYGIRGIVGEPLNGTQTITVTRSSDDAVSTLLYADFATTVAGDVTDWFTNLPAGLKATAASPSGTGSQAVVITITGTPEKASKVNEVIKMKIPKTAFKNGAANDITVAIATTLTGTNAKAEINVHPTTSVKTLPKPVSLYKHEAATTTEKLTIDTTAIPAVTADATNGWKIAYAWFYMKDETDPATIALAGTAGATGAAGTAVTHDQPLTVLNGKDPGNYYFVCKITTTYAGATTSAANQVLSTPVKVTVTEKLDKTDGGTIATGESSTNVGVYINGDTTLGTNSADKYRLDLSEEKLVVDPTFELAAYSIDGGKKWKDYKKGLDTFNEKDLLKLLNKGMTLAVSNKAIDKKTKQPDGGGTVVVFDKIEAREKPAKYVANYFVDSATNEWGVTAKGATTALNTTITGNMELAPLAKGVKQPEPNEWKSYTAYDRKVVEFGGEKAATHVYRIKAHVNTVGKIIPATKMTKIKAVAEIKAPKLKVKVDKKAFTGAVNYKANTEIDGTLYKTAGEVKVSNGDKLNIRIAATTTKPRSALQELEVSGIPEKE